MAVGRNDAFGAFERSVWENAEVALHYDRGLGGVARQSVGALLDAAGTVRGSRVLDVATGAGAIAAAAAQRGAEAIGVDFSASQLAFARQRNPGLRFEVADAAALPFPDESFDAVASGFGMLHFPDPDAVAREAFRVLRPGGRFAFSAWDAPPKTVAFAAMFTAIRMHGSLDVGLPEGPDFFQFSEPLRCEQVLVGAGFQEPSVRQVMQVWKAPGIDQVFESLLRGTVRTRSILLAQGAEALARIRASLAGELADFRRGEAYEIPMMAVLATGTKPTPDS